MVSADPNEANVSECGVPVSNAVMVPAWIRQLSKIELHVHLEGTVAPETLLELAAGHGIDPGFSSVAEAQAFFAYRDFPHFINVFIQVCDCLRSPADFGRIVREYGECLARQRVMYAELHFSPEPHARRRGIEFHAMLGAMNEARLELQSRYGLELRWIADGVRDAASGPASVERTVDWMIEAGPSSGIVALGLGGDEQRTPPHLFSKAFARARKAGFHVTAHAGETTGPERIRQTVEVLEVERIGHGISARYDPALLELLGRRHIPLELCPTSNLRTGVIPDLESLTLRGMLAAGVPVSINSDDPALFNTSLEEEYARIVDAFSLTKHELVAIVESGITQSFADEEMKTRLRHRLKEELKRQELALTDGFGHP
jgi:adenosine deaminase